MLSASGSTTFNGKLQAPTGVTIFNDRGLWSDRSGALALVVREGSQAPGTPAGANFDDIGPMAVNASGEIAFRAGLPTTGGGSTEGVWAERSGTLVLVAREGSQAPGTPSGANFDSLSNELMWNSLGQTAFRATLQITGGGVTFEDNEGVWSEGSGTLALVARRGSQAPGAPKGANFSHFNSVAFNSAGQTAFGASLKVGDGGVTFNNFAGIWSEGSGTLALVARGGSEAPGTPAGALFGNFSAPVLNAAGQAAFLASLQIGGGGVTGFDAGGVWSEGSGKLALVARKGHQAPGTAGGVNFDTFSSPTLNASGGAAFIATLQTTGGGVTSDNNQGIWAEDRSGALTLVVRTGDPLMVAPGDLRTLASLSFTTDSGGEDGQRISFNDNFTLAFRANFTDGTSGIFTATLQVPEAEALMLFVHAIVVTLAFRRFRCCC